jgi:magnesium transporter
MPTLAELVEGADIERLNDWLNETNTVAIAEELARLDPEQRAVPFRLLAKDEAIEVFEALDPTDQQALLDSLRDERVVQLFEAMDPDDRARLVDEMPAKVARRLLAGLSPWERALTSTLLGYPEDKAGRIMSPEFVSLRAGMSVEQALDKVRRAGRSAETVYALPVTDDQRRLIGAIGLRDIVLADPDQRIGDLMETDVYSARVDDDQETVARLIGEANLLALPIVDTENRLVGIVTVDDAIAILEEEETEDIARTGGAEPVGRPYFTVSVFRLARTRIVWLFLLIFAATLTVSVLDVFQATLEQIVTLSLFIPLLIGTGGNTGAQSATTVVRALAVGEVRFEDLPRVVFREARVGLMLGLGLGLIALVPVSLLFEPRPQMGVIVAITIVTICTYASTVGSLLPILAGRVGLDPAVLSAPSITTIVDASGLVIYFLIAKAVLGI